MDAGTIRWDDALSSTSRVGTATTQISRAAFIPQSPALILSPFLRCGTQVRDILQAGGTSGTLASSRVEELFHEAGLPEERRVAQAFPHELSGGELQRVTIARALAMDPQLLVADETCSSLDAIQAAAFRDTIRSLSNRHRLSVVWITHNPRELLGFADRVLVLEQGVVADYTDADAFLRGDVAEPTKKLLSAMPFGWQVPAEKSPPAYAREPARDA